MARPLIRRLLPPVKRKRFGKFGSLPKNITVGREMKLDLKQFTQERQITIRRKGVRFTRFPQEELEKRAVPDRPPHRGSVQERIVYRQALKDHMVPDVDFSFQPAIEGGRRQLGGLVADFIFLHLGGRKGLVVQVNGTIWHTGRAPEARDALTKSLLEQMGYEVRELWDTEIADVGRFEDWWERNIRFARVSPKGSLFN